MGRVRRIPGAEIDAAARDEYQAMAEDAERQAGRLTNDRAFRLGVFLGGLDEARRFPFKLRKLRAPHRGKRDEIPDSAVLQAWRMIRREHPEYSVVGVDQAVGAKLGLHEKTVRNRRIALGYKGKQLARLA